MKSSKNAKGPHGGAAGRPGEEGAPAAIPRALKFVAAAGVVGSLLLAATFFFYAHALADDYSRGGKVVKYGGLAGAVTWEYHNWSGRWSGFGATALAWSIADLTDPAAYRACIVLWAILFAVSVHVFVCTVLGQKLLGRTGAVLSLSFLSLYWVGMLSPAETFYWLSGTAEQHGAAALALLIVSGILLVARRGATTQAVAAVGLMALAVVMTGMHELYGLIFCMVLVLGAALTAWKKTPGRWVWAAVALATIGGLIFVIQAPGNFERQKQCRVWLEHWTWRQQLAYTWHFFQGHVRGHLFPWLIDGRLWAATLLVLLAPGLAGVRPGWIENARIRWRFWIPAVWAAATAAMFSIPAWATGSDMPARTYNVIYLVLLIAWFLTAFVLGHEWRGRVPAAVSRPVVLAMLVLWPVGLLSTGNTYRAFQDLTEEQKVYVSFKATYDRSQRVVVFWPRDAPSVQMTRVRAFDAQMRWREEHVGREARDPNGARRIMVPPFQPPAPGLFLDMRVMDLSANPNYWANREMADCLGIEAIQTPPRNP